MNENRYRRTYGASPLYSYPSPAVPATGSWVLSPEDEDATTKKYLPFNMANIVNNSGVTLKIYVNQGPRYFVMAPGTIVTLDKTTIPALTTVRVKNTSATTAIAADAITVTLQREAVGTTELAQTVHKLLWKRGYM